MPLNKAKSARRNSEKRWFTYILQNWTSESFVPNYDEIDSESEELNSLVDCAKTMHATKKICNLQLIVGVVGNVDEIKWNKNAPTVIADVKYSGTSRTTL